MKITGTTILFGVIGNPVKHSFSPIMHNAAFEKLGLNCVYIPMEVPSEQLENAVKGLSALGIKGINVTIPYKEAVIPFVDNLSPQATTIGTVNTILVHDKGKLLGYNTDGEGFINSLKEDLDFDCKGKTLCILGTGGSGRAIAIHCAMNHAKKIIISGRDKTKAQQLADRVTQFYPTTKTVALDLKDKSIKDMIESSDLLINATSIGMKQDDLMLISPEWLHTKLKVYDLVYNPLETKMTREAKKKGCQVVNGLGMLIHQGALSFRIWLGVTPPMDIMKQAILEHIRHQHESEGD